MGMQACPVKENGYKQLKMPEQGRV